MRYEEHKSYSKYVNEMNQLIDLYNGNYKCYYTINSDGRIHTNLTRLTKVYRRFVRFDNKHLVEVDLSNSIIYFLSMYLNNKIDISTININNPFLALMFEKSMKNVDIAEKELLESKAVTGEFYDLFIDDFRITYSEEELKNIYAKDNSDDFKGDYKQIRKIVKSQILAMLFAETKHYQVEQELFSKKFPSVILALNNFKNVLGYKKLSHLLFQTESYFMLDVVARKFNLKNWRNAPVFSLHDCVITTVDYQIDLESILLETFMELLRIAPKTKKKEWIN